VIDVSIDKVVNQPPPEFELLYSIGVYRFDEQHPVAVSLLHQSDGPRVAAVRQNHLFAWPQVQASHFMQVPLPRSVHIEVQNQVVVFPLVGFKS